MLLTDLLTAYIAERLNLLPESAAQLLYTLRNYERFLRHPATLADLSTANVLAFMRTYSNAWTANRNRRNLLTLWRFAATLDLLPDPPNIPTKRETTPTPICWTIEEVGRIWEATDLIEGNWHGCPARLAWKLAIALLWDSGTRIKTLYLAELSEVNLRSGTWRAPAEHIKGRRADRVFQLHPETVQLVSDTYKFKRCKLWPFPYSLHAAYDHLRRLLTLAGLPTDRLHLFHCIRKSVESYAADRVGIEAAAAMIGHSAAVAKRHYVSPRICKPANLIDIIPRPF